MAGMSDALANERIRSRIAPGIIVWPVMAAALLALSSYIRVPIPGSPVPMTMQVVAVLMIGGLMAPSAALAATAVFAAAGAAGLPVFHGGGAGLLHLAGPTGGYILGFLAAAPIVARGIAGRRESILRVAVWMALGIAVIHLLGMAQLALWLGGDVRLAFLQGVVPFLPLDVVKIAVAAPAVAGLAALRGR